MSTIVAFHVGRGGRFNNPYHKTYESHITDFQWLLSHSDNLFIHNEDEEGNALPDNDWKLMDGNGNVLLEGREAIQSETGMLDIDGGYDTTIVQYIEDCDESELNILLQAYKDGELSKSLIPEILAAYPCELSLVDEDGGFIHIGNRAADFIEYAGDEPCRLLADEVEVWCTADGMDRLKEILKGY